MTMSVYEAGRYRFIFGMVVVAAVLLSLVVATGYLLIVGENWYKVTFASAVVTALAFGSLKAARGSQCRAFARASSTVLSPAPAPGPRLVEPVHEASFVHKGVQVPLGEAFDLLLES